MKKGEDKVECRTPTPGKSSTRIGKWKFNLVRDAILKAVPRDGAGVEFRKLPSLVNKQLAAADRARLGSVPWYTTTVKLEMEVRGEIQRIPESKPQRIRRGR